MALSFSPSGRIDSSNTIPRPNKNIHQIKHILGDHNRRLSTYTHAKAEENLVPNPFSRADVDRECGEQTCPEGNKFRTKNEEWPNAVRLEYHQAARIGHWQCPEEGCPHQRRRDSSLELLGTNCRFISESALSRHARHGM